MKAPVWGFTGSRQSLNRTAKNDPAEANTGSLLLRSSGELLGLPLKKGLGFRALGLNLGFRVKGPVTLLVQYPRVSK